MHILRAVSPITGSVVCWDFGAGPVRQQPGLRVTEGSEIRMNGIHTGPVVASIRGEDGLIVLVELVERPRPIWDLSQLPPDPAREG